MRRRLQRAKHRLSLNQGTGLHSLIKPGFPQQTQTPLSREYFVLLLLKTNGNIFNDGDVVAVTKLES